MSDPRHDKAIATLRQAASERKLVAIIGTGVSIGLAPGNPALSWTGLVKDGFAYALRKGKISLKQSDRWQSQIHSTEMDELLLAAEFIGGRLGAPNGDLYSRWLDDAFATVKPTSKPLIEAVATLKAAAIPLCTLNYDHLLEEVTELPPITIDDTRRATAFLRGESRGILHLHGSFQQPRTCVLGVRDYATTLDSEVRDLMQRTISAFGHLLFIGCGGTFADPNFSNLIRWLRSNLGAAAPEHHALVLDQDVVGCETDPAWHGFVRPVGYGADHNALPTFIGRCFANLTAHSSAIAPPASQVLLELPPIARTARTPAQTPASKNDDTHSVPTIGPPAPTVISAPARLPPAVAESSEATKSRRRHNRIGLGVMAIVGVGIGAWLSMRATNPPSSDKSMLNHYHLPDVAPNGAPVGIIDAANPDSRIASEIDAGMPIKTSKAGATTIIETSQAGATTPTKTSKAGATIPTKTSKAGATIPAKTSKVSATISNKPSYELQCRDWSSAKKNIDWVLFKDKGAQNSYKICRILKGSKFECVQTAQSHNKAAREQLQRCWAAVEDYLKDVDARTPEDHLKDLGARAT